MNSQAASKRQTSCLNMSPRALRKDDLPWSASETGRDLLLRSKHRLFHWLPIKQKDWENCIYPRILVLPRQGSLHWLPLQNKSSTNLLRWLCWACRIQTSRAMTLKQFNLLCMIATLVLWPRLICQEILPALTATVKTRHGLKCSNFPIQYIQNRHRPKMIFLVF